MERRSTPQYDIVIRNGKVFDGTGRPGRIADLAVAGERVVAVSEHLDGVGRSEIDAKDNWVLPGFLDIHTHYDVEVEQYPGLDESVRHGVTTVLMGNCSLSLALGNEQDLLDLYCRVENLSRELLARWLKGKIVWHTVSEYYQHLETLPLGPNVATLLGHSNVRAQVMGLERSLREPHANDNEIAKMRSIIEEAMSEGFLGLSIDMLPWHRMDGKRHDNLSIPSQCAGMKEYRALADVVRQYDRILQSTPNALAKKSMLQLISLSAGLRSKPLRTTIVAAVDVKADRKVYLLLTTLASFANRFLRANVRFQALAAPFLLYSDGIVSPVFEEFSAGIDALSVTAEERKGMFADTTFRTLFRRDWERKGSRAFHRDLADMWIVASPDPHHIGKSFAQLAAQQGKEAIEYFMDLITQYDDQVRWKSVVANDRETSRRYLLAHPFTLPGFNDSGAHSRNMAFHDGALQMLQQALNNPQWISIEKAVARLTSEPATWLGLEVGTLLPGKQADIVIINPEKLRSGLGDPIEYQDERLDGFMRMVRRSNGIVQQVLISGKVAFERGEFTRKFGRERFGRLLRVK
ncbi:MAG: amidohydrolase family protein [Acidobacteriota bacterium]